MPLSHDYEEAEYIAHVLGFVKISANIAKTCKSCCLYSVHCWYYIIIQCDDLAQYKIALWEVNSENVTGFSKILIRKIRVPWRTVMIPVLYIRLHGSMSMVNMWFRVTSGKSHYNYVTWAAWRLKSTASRSFVKQLFRLTIKETSNLRTTGPLWEAHKGVCMRKAFPCHDVIILLVISVTSSQYRQYCCIDSGCDRKSNFPIIICSDSSNLKNFPRSYMQLWHQLSCGGVCQIWMRFKRAKIILQY